eukprot:650387_1
MKSAIGLCLPLCCLLIVCFQFHTSVLGANDKGIYSKEIRKKYSIGYDSIDSVEIQKTNNVYGDSSDATEIQNKNKCTFCKMESAMFTCKGCNQARYCRKKCQKLHWQFPKWGQTIKGSGNDHKSVCGKTNTRARLLRYKWNSTHTGAKLKLKLESAENAIQACGGDIAEAVKFVEKAEKLVLDFEDPTLELAVNILEACAGNLQDAAGYTAKILIQVAGSKGELRQDMKIKTFDTNAPKFPYESFAFDFAYGYANNEPTSTPTREELSKKWKKRFERPKNTNRLTKRQLKKMKHKSNNYKEPTNLK